MLLDPGLLDGNDAEDVEDVEDATDVDDADDLRPFLPSFVFGSGAGFDVFFLGRYL